MTPLTVFAACYPFVCVCVGNPNYNGISHRDIDMPMVCTCRGCQGIAEGWHQRRPFCFPVKSTWDAESTYLQFVTYSSYKLCIDSLKSSLLRDLLQHFCLSFNIFVYSLS